MTRKLVFLGGMNWLFHSSKEIKQKFKTIQKKHKITKEEQITALKEDLKQNLQAKAQQSS